MNRDVTGMQTAPTPPPPPPPPAPWRDDPIFEEDTPQAARTIQIIYVLAVGEVAGEVKGILKPNFSGLYFLTMKS